MYSHLLLRLRVYSELTLALFDSGAVTNVISRKVVDKLHIRMVPTTRRIKVANCAFQKCLSHLRDLEHLENVFAIVKENGIHLRIKKCSFMKSSVE